MKDFLSVLARKASGSIRHDTLSLRTANGRAQIRFGRLAKDAGSFAALWGVGWNHVISWLDGSHTFSDRLNNTTGFVAKDARKEALME